MSADEAQGADASPSLAIDHFVLTVADIDKTLEFYQTALDMRPLKFTAADGSVRAALAFGSSKINLHAAENTFAPKALAPTLGSADFCLRTAASISDIQARLAAAGVLIEEGPVARTGALGPLQSIYFRDPDGNLVEVSHQEGV